MGLLQLTTLFGYAVVITNLQTDDVLFFDGNKWINMPMVADPVGYLDTWVAPDTSDNQTLALFTLDGIMVRNYVRRTYISGAVLGLEAVNMVYPGYYGETQNVLAFSAMWYRRIADYTLVPEMDFDLTQEEETHVFVVPLLDIDDTSEDSELISGTPILEYSIV
jgi:hypothetical protein